MTTADDVLDNAGWHALTGPQAAFAEGGGAARRYRSDVSVFHAAADDQPESWDELIPLAVDGVVVLFRGVPMTSPAGWRRVFGGEGHQMVLTGALPTGSELADVDPRTGQRGTVRVLTDDDVDDMVALVARTEPGPFRPRTIELGGYIGIFHDERLVAMAGRRIRPPGHCEVSAVCTHPDARRRGYASILTADVARAIAAEGDVPILHVATTNHSARAVYEHLGFTIRRVVAFAAFRIPDCRSGPRAGSPQR